MCTPRSTHLHSTTAILTLTGSTHHLPYGGEGGRGGMATPGKAASLGMNRTVSAESGTATWRGEVGGGKGGQVRDHGPTEWGTNDERVEGGEGSGKAAGR